MEPITFIIAAVFGVAVGCLSYFFYFKKTQTPQPVKKAAIIAAVTAGLTIIIGIITE